MPASEPETGEPAAQSIAAPTIVEPTAAQLREVLAPYERGQCLHAFRIASEIGPLQRWRGTAACITAGRIAGNLGAMRLACALWCRAWRNDRNDPEARVYFARALADRRGPLACWRFAVDAGATIDMPPALEAEWLGLQAGVLGHFRDFERAHERLQRARALSPDDPWLFVEEAGVLLGEDRYDAALAAAETALGLQAYYRPAVQAAAHALDVLGRDDEAIELLEAAAARLESFSICGQLGQALVDRDEHQRAGEAFARAVELAPLAERDVADAFRTARAQVAYLCGNPAEAADLLDACTPSPLQATHVARLRDHRRATKRVVLPVGFVRQHHVTCGPATLTALAEYWSQPVDHLELAEAICYDGTSNYSERRWAQDRGWVTREFTVTFDGAKALIDRGVPFALTTVDPGAAHLQAVVGYDEKLGALVLREPRFRHRVHIPDTVLAEKYRSTGPRGLVLVPAAEARRLDGLELHDADHYDRLHALEAALARHRRDEASAIHEEMSARAPDHRLTCMAGLSLARYDGNDVLGLEFAERLLALYPDDPLVLLFKLGLLNGLGRRAERWEIYERVTADRDCPDLFRQQYAREIADDHSQSARAERMLGRALIGGGDVGVSLTVLAEIAWRRLDAAWGRELYRLAACVEDKNEHYAQMHFAACRFAGREDEALRMLEQRFELLGTRSSQPAISWSWALDQLDRTSAAIEVLEAGIAKRPDDGPLLLYATAVMADLGEIDRAEALLARAEPCAPRQMWHRTAARLAFRRGELTEALAHWRRVLAIDPLAPDAHAQVASLLADTGGREAAIRHLREAIERFPYHQPLHQALLEWLPRDDADAVETVIRQIIAGDPSDAWAWRELVCHLGLHRRYDEAFAALAEAERLDPNHPASWTVRGDLCMQAGRAADGRAAFRRAVEINADNPVAVAGLVSLAADRAARREILDFIGSRLREHLVEGSAVQVFAALASNTFDLAELVEHMEGLRDANPQVWSTWSVLTDALVNADRLDDALAVAAEARDRFPFIPEVALNLSSVQQARGDAPAAIEALERALRVNPDFGPVVRELAAVRDRLGEFEEAQRILAHAVRRRPRDPDLRVDLAGQCLKLGDVDGARRQLRQAIECDPCAREAWEQLMALTEPDAEARSEIIDWARRNADARPGSLECGLMLARVLPRDTPLDERLEVLEHCEQLHPNHRETKHMKAWALAEAGRYDEALAVCDTAIHGVVPVSLRVLAGRIEAIRGDLPTALRRMRRLLDEEPQLYEAWSDVADWSVLMGDLETARRAAEQMMQLAPRHAPSLVYVADVLIKTGQPANARVLLERALDLVPDYEYAALALLRILLSERAWKDAAVLLHRLKNRLRPVTLEAARVEMAVARRSAAGALGPLGTLCRMADADADDALANSVTLIAGAGWAEELEKTLQSAVQSGEAHPSAAYWWIRLAAYRLRFAVICRVILNMEGPYRREALRAALTYAAQTRQDISLVQRLVRGASEDLRDDDELFAVASWAYLTAGNRRRVATWIHGWRDRTGMHPMAYAHIAMAEFFLGDEAAAREAIERGLQLPRDATALCLALWLGLLDALDGDSETGRAALARSNRDNFDPYLRALAGLLDLLCGAATRPPAAVRREARALPARHVALRTEPELRRAYRRAISRIAVAQGGAWAAIWKWSVLTSETMRPAPSVK
jgi:tetratricopeptide (TPR) repeat protein